MINRKTYILVAVVVFGISARGTAFAEAESGNVLKVETARAAELTQMLDAVADLRARGDRTPVTVELADGTYRLSETLTITPQLTGEGLTLKAKTPGQAILSGGRELTKVKFDEAGHWRFELPHNWQKFGTPPILVINGQLKTPARFPNHGYHRIERALEDRRSGFVIAPENLPAKLDLSTDACTLVLLHDWSSSRLPVASLALDTRTLRTVGPIGCSAAHYAIDHFEKQPRYWLEGHPSFADQPGEWFVDHQRGEVVIVADRPSAAPPLVVLPWLAEILVAQGTDVAPLHNLDLDGLAFTASRLPMPAGGFASAQATMHEPRTAEGAQAVRGRPMLISAVRIERAAGCRVRNCQFQSLGATALCIGSRTRNCAVAECRFDDIGGNCLNLGEDTSRRVRGTNWYRGDPDQVPKDNRVEGCEISNCGVMLPGAVGVWASLHRNLLLTGNHIHDCPYTGVSLGWIWSEAPSPAAANVIRGNTIEYVMQVLSDGGGIYTLGRQPGSIIERNVIRDVPLNAGRAESNGMFLDQGTAGFTIRENTIRRIDRSPLRFHQAGKNLVANNRWELATPTTPGVRFNNTPEDNITIRDNTVLTAKQRIFLIGNSLTWDTVPSRLEGDVHWHVDCGKSLKYIFDHPQQPCVRSSRHWPNALQSGKYDYVVFQPHYGTTLEEDIRVISTWLDLQPRAVCVLHTGWPYHEKLADEYAAADASGKLLHSPAYFGALSKQLRVKYPDREIRSTHAMDLLARIQANIKEQTAPLKSIADLYRDSIHMTHGPGRYLMHNAMRRALGQSSSAAGFSDVPDPIRSYLDGIVAAQYGESP